jgi:hypothetical protein
MASDMVAVAGIEMIGREGLSQIKVLIDVSSSNCSIDLGCVMLLIVIVMLNEMYKEREICIRF